MTQLPDLPLSGLYGDLILDHSRSPRHRDPVPAPDVQAEEFNPFCGDRVALQLKLGDGCRVVEVGVQSEGCSIIQATASIMSDALLGKRLEEMEHLAQVFRDLMRGKNEIRPSPEALGPLQALQVVRQYPVRIKCALLPWTALEEGIEDYRSSQTRDQ
jgi:nitrogen fixation NifU-like protein